MGSFASNRTPGGYRCDECASAMQKSIRRGLERESLHWATELDLAGYGDYVWRRLRVIASEDVGMADPMALPIAAAAAQAVEFVGLPEAMHNLSHAVIYLANAPKSNGAKPNSD